MSFLLPYPKRIGVSETRKKIMRKIKSILTIIGLISAIQCQANFTLTLDSYASTALTSEGGGPFIVTLHGSDIFNGIALNTGNGLTYTTFCIEDNEYINFGGVYNAKLNSGASNGGIGGQYPFGSNFDPLSIGTSYLYSQWSEGNINKELGPQIQKAIWALEDEKSVSYIESSIETLLRTKFGTSSDISTWKTTASVGLNGVYVVNLGNTQDQLICVPESGNLAAFLLLLIPVAIYATRKFKYAK